MKKLEFMDLMLESEVYPNTTKIKKVAFMMTPHSNKLMPDGKTVPIANSNRVMVTFDSGKVRIYRKLDLFLYKMKKLGVSAEKLTDIVKELDLGNEYEEED